MSLNLLTSATDPMRAVDIGEAALYALLGFAVVFVGISFLILIVWLAGKLIHKDKSPVSVKETKTEAKEITESLAVADAENVSEETVAVITAALMAYYQANNPKCEFIVKRIKRI